MYIMMYLSPDKDVVECHVFTGVCNSVHGWGGWVVGYLWSLVPFPFRGRYMGVGYTYTTPEGTWHQRYPTPQKGYGTRDIIPLEHKNGRYAFFWNVFLSNVFSTFIVFSNFQYDIYEIIFASIVSVHTQIFLQVQWECMGLDSVGTLVSVSKALPVLLWAFSCDLLVLVVFQHSNYNREYEIFSDDYLLSFVSDSYIPQAYINRCLKMHIYSWAIKVLPLKVLLIKGELWKMYQFRFSFAYFNKLFK